MPETPIVTVSTVEDINNAVRQYNKVQFEDPAAGIDLLNRDKNQEVRLFGQLLISYFGHFNRVFGAEARDLGSLGTTYWRWAHYWYLYNVDDNPRCILRVLTGTPPFLGGSDA